MSAYAIDAYFHDVRPKRAAMVISIWGATHPFAGFLGWGQDEKNIVQIDLYCRPCSVFGNKPCYRGDHACMNRIEEEMVFEKAGAKSKELP